MQNTNLDFLTFGINGNTIQQAEHLYGQIIQEFPVAFYMCDIEGYLLYYNEAAEILWGRKPKIKEELWCGSWKIFNPENGDPIDPVTCPMAISLKEGRAIFGEEILIERPDGTRKHILANPKPIFNSNSEFVGAYNILVDITSRKEAELRVIESERFLQNMVSSSHDCIKVLDLEGRLLSMNEKGQQIAEIDDMTPFLGAFYIDLWKDAKEEACQALEDARNGGTGRFVGWLPTLKTNTSIWWDIVITPIPDLKGQPDRLLVVARDITKYKLLQEEFKERNKELLRINDDLDNFIYTASHDLRSPITNIEGLVNTLKSTLKNEKISDINEVGLMLNLIDKSINRFKRTILDLTEISKVQRVHAEDIHSIQCSDIIKDVMLSIQNKIDEANANIMVDTTACNSIVFSRKNFKSIVYNLIGNAVKYKHPDRKCEISIRIKKEDGYTVLTVQDNGLGINVYHMPKLFSMFKRFHDHVEGTGIGLYIIKRIIDNAGGKIEVSSELDKGTVFNVYFKEQL